MYRVFALLGLSFCLATASQAYAATAGDPSFTNVPMRPSLPPGGHAGELAMTLPPAADIAEALGAGPATRQALGPKVTVRVNISSQTMTVLGPWQGRPCLESLHGKARLRNADRLLDALSHARHVALA